MRGTPLDDDCKKAKIATHEYAPYDNRKYCYGIFDLMTDEVLDKCSVCGAYVCNARPLDNNIKI